MSSRMSRLLVLGVMLAVGVGAVGAEEEDATSTAGFKGLRFKARLGGFQEVPAVSTSGHGAFAAKVTQDGIAFELRYAGLQGELTPAVSLHFGQKGVRGGLVTVLCGGGVRPECPAGEGTVKGLIRPGEVVGPEDQGISAGQIRELIRAMRHGQTYVHVHTTAFPSGEIRGQIVKAKKKKGK